MAGAESPVVPFEGNVRFTLTLRAFERDDHWMARALQTGIIGYGKTSDEAKRNASAASQAVVRRWKLQGRDALEGFLQERGIKYSLDGELRHEPLGDNVSLGA